MQLLLASILLVTLSAYLLRQFRDQIVDRDSEEPSLRAQVEADDAPETLKAA